MRSRRLSLLALAALVAALAAASPRLAAAQQAAGAAVGASPAPLVRLSTPDIAERPHVVGELVESSADALTVRTGAGENVIVPRSIIRRYEVSRGRTPRGTSVRRAALIGIVLGAVVGIALTPDHAEGESSKATSYTVTGALLGGVAGGVFGSLDRPERWQRADLPPPK